jgi:hypothetical protein
VRVFQKVSSCVVSYHYSYCVQRIDAIIVLLLLMVLLPLLLQGYIAVSAKSLSSSANAGLLATANALPTVNSCSAALLHCTSVCMTFNLLPVNLMC